MAEETSEKERANKKIDVSVPQVTGGALASVTAAALGSQLGVAGTFWGAGLTSVVITVGGAVYQRSLERGQEKANEAAAKAKLKLPKGRDGHSLRADQPGPGKRPGQPPATDPDAERTQRYGPVAPPARDDERTRRIMMGNLRPDEPRAHGEGGVDPDAQTRKLRWDGTQYVPVQADEPGESTEDGARPRRARWAMLALTGVLMFGLCMVIITTFEGVTGKPLSGGEQGTSIGSVLTGSTGSVEEPPADHEPGQPPGGGSEEAPPPTGESVPETPGDGSSPGGDTGEGDSPGNVETPGEQPGQEPVPEPPANEQPQDAPAEEPGVQQEVPGQQSEPG